MVECILNEYRILFISTEIYSLVLRSVYDCHRTVCVFVTLAMSLPVSSIGQSTTSVGGADEKLDVLASGLEFACFRWRIGAGSLICISRRA